MISIKRLRAALAAVMCCGISVLSAGAQETARIAAMQVAEDSRRTDSASLAPLRDALRGTDVALQVNALRALGRFENDALLADILPFLSSASAAVRVEAANAAAQATARNAAAASPRVFAALSDRATLERDRGVMAVLARSMGRLALTTADQVRNVELLALGVASEGADSTTHEMALLTLERLSRLLARVAPLSPETLESVQQMATDARVNAASRRLAFTITNTARRATPEFLAITGTDADAQVRRLTVAAAATLEASLRREQLLLPFFRDAEPIVRLEVVRGWFRSPVSSCAPILAAVEDSIVAVATAAVDGLAQSGARCPAAERSAALTLLKDLADGMVTQLSMRAYEVNRFVMHTGAHALVALATAAPEEARNRLAAASRHPGWVARMYATRVASTLADSNVLLRASRDAHANVRAVAIPALSRVLVRGADSILVRALADSDYSVVMAAATALRRSPSTAPTVLALKESMTRLTSERRETSRDARAAVLTALEALGTANDSAFVMHLVRDFDPVIAERAARMSGEWAGRPIEAQPVLLPRSDLPPASQQIRGNVRLRFTMSREATGTGGSFEVEVLASEAAWTAGRLLKLVDRGYYQGLTFHRVVANFVVQGGSPGANEYVGDGPFMRDELWLHSHSRGTVGISTRGRDTGDAQIFINTVDNPRLDFEYTVFARVVSGMDVIDAIAEGDVISRVEVVR